MTRYVFDTNVLVSALLFQASKPGLAFDRALDSGTILTSAECIGELNDVLSRAKFNRYVDPDGPESIPRHSNHHSGGVPAGPRLTLSQAPGEGWFRQEPSVSSTGCTLHIT